MADERRWLIYGLTLTVALAVLDLTTGDGVNFTAVYFLGALLAASQCPPRPTAAVAAFGLACTVVITAVLELGTATVVVRALLASVGGSLCVLFADRRVRREARLASVERVAEVAQRALLTTVPDEVAGIAFAARYESATEGARIGGDLYEVIPTDRDRVRILVGDVCGHGLPAVRLAAATLAAFREAAVVCKDLEDAARLVDHRLQPQLVDDEFVTAVLAEFGPDGTLTIVNCGHPAPLIVGSDGRHRLPAGGSTSPLGVGPAPQADDQQVDAGDRILFYTDGLIEGRTSSGRGIAVESFSPLIPGGTLADALERVLTSLHEQVGTLEDDLALLLAEIRDTG